MKKIKFCSFVKVKKWPLCCDPIQTLVRVAGINYFLNPNSLTWRHCAKLTIFKLQQCCPLLFWLWMCSEHLVTPVQTVAFWYIHVGQGNHGPKHQNTAKQRIWWRHDWLQLWYAAITWFRNGRMNFHMWTTTVWMH